MMRIPAFHSPQPVRCRRAKAPIVPPHQRPQRSPDHFGFDALLRPVLNIAVQFNDRI